MVPVYTVSERLPSAAVYLGHFDENDIYFIEPDERHHAVMFYRVASNNHGWVRASISQNDLCRKKVTKFMSNRLNILYTKIVAAYLDRKSDPSISPNSR